MAVVGAGLAGLAAAEVLEEAGLCTVLFDKGRAPGGRTCTRRSSRWSFDHGAQYFTARDPAFRERVEGWCWGGLAARWEGRLASVQDRELAPLSGDDERFVGVPSMCAVARALAEPRDVRSGVRIAAAEHGPRGWTLLAEGGGEAAGPFEAVLVTTPPAQAAPLVAPSEELSELAGSVTMTPCWAAMAAFEVPHPLARDGAPVDGLFVNDGPLSWAARNSSKPGRPPGDAWVLHASPTWTRAHLAEAKGDVGRALVDALGEATGTAAPPLCHLDAHRWMYANVEAPAEVGAAFDADAGLGLAGDWLAGAKVQGAWLSGHRLGTEVAAALGAD